MNPPLTILIAEDEQPIREGLEDLLTGEGYNVLSACDGQEALDMFHREKPDLALLDIMMPRLSGYDLCREIRKTDARLPIVFLTAREEEIDKVLGLEMGADDYIVKPFGVRELLARIKSVLRRCTPAASGTPDPGERFSFAGGTVDRRRFTYIPEGGTPVELTEREVELLVYFAARPDQVLSRKELLEKIWGFDYYGTTRTLDQHLAKLRQKVEPDSRNPRFFLTVHGTGYRYRP